MSLLKQVLTIVHPDVDKTSFLVDSVLVFLLLDRDASVRYNSVCMRQRSSVGRAAVS